MAGLYLPLCSVFFSSLICVVFFLKKRVNLIENKMYSVMLISSVIDSLFATFLQVMALDGITINEHFLVYIYNKIDFLALISFTNSMLLYILIISSKKEFNFNKYLKIFLFLDILFYIAILFTPINIIQNNNNYSINGLAVNLTYILCGIYIVSSILVTLKNIKKFDTRYIPIVAIIGITAVLLLIFKLNPYLIIISIALTFLDYIMFYTIENPDYYLIQELKKLNQQNKEYNSDKTLYIYNITQRIKYPLNLITQFSDQISKSNNNIEIQNINDSIKSETKKIATIVNESLNINRADTNKLKITKNKYNMLNILNEIKLKVDKGFIGEKIDFRFNYDKNIPSVLYGDGLRIKQIILNLLNNSVYNTKNGFIDFSINCIITFDICRLVIKIKDSSEGYSDKEFESILNEGINNTNFFTKTELNYQDIKELASLTGGLLSIENEKGLGLEYTLIIDQKIPNEENIDIDKYDDVVKSFKFLIVCDEEIERKYLKKKLKYFDKMTFANNGEECLNNIRSGIEYNAIFIKNNMIKLNAEKTFEKLKLIDSFNIPVILLGGKGDIDNSDYYKSSGFYDVIDKNISVNTINEIIKRLLT